MNSLRSFASVARDTYSRIKPVIAMLLAGAIVIAPAIPLDGLQVAAIGALGVIILETLFDIHRIVNIREQSQIYAEFFDAAQAMKSAIIEYAKRKRHVRIRALGMSMGHAWPFLINILQPLLDSNVQCSINLEIAMLDSKWQQLEKINPNWKAKSETLYDEINRFSKANLEKLNAKQWHISVVVYSHMPNWHGILLDEELLFLSTCFWRDGKLTGAENQYELYRSSDKQLGVHRISQFVTWFDYIKANDLETKKTA